MSHKTVKRCSTSLIIQELQMKISMSSQHILTGMDAMQRMTIPNERKSVRQFDISSWQKMQNDQTIELAKDLFRFFYLM